ncbi:MAG: SDR family NAD(P)-dependent oxidoreductase, partial [Spirochaetota bacterium]
LGQDLDTKVLGYLRCIEAVAPGMQTAGWGRIVNIGGLAARNSASLSGMRNLALVHLSKTLSDQLGPSGVTVNAVHPGATRTELPGEEDSRRRTADNAIGRIVDAHEIAWLVAFLCSPKAGAITVESIGAGGGVGQAVFA